MARSRLISNVSATDKYQMRCSLAGKHGPTFVQLDVHRAPPDLIPRRLLVDNALVLRAATCLLAREVDEGTRGRDDGTLVPDRILVEQGYRGIALDLDPVHVETGLREVLEVAADHWAHEQAVSDLATQNKIR